MHGIASLEERYRLLMDRVAAAAVRSGRCPDEVFVVAVTKYAELDDILELIALGHMDFGESRVPQLIDRAHAVQDLLADGDAFEARLRAIRRARSLSDDPARAGTGHVHHSGGILGLDRSVSHESSAPEPHHFDAGTRAIGGIIGGIDVSERSGIGRAAPVREGDDSRSAPVPAASSRPQHPSPRWHMIGHLQRNKVRKCLEVTRLVHSVDSLRLIEEVHSWAFKKDREVDVLLQVNCSGESHKDGCAPAAALHLAETIESMIHLRLRGLMTMAPLSDDPDEARPAFAMCRELFEDIRAKGIGQERFNLLSMGMSGDFEIGIECGANIVRIGSALFGEREIDDSLEGDAADPGGDAGGG